MPSFASSEPKTAAKASFSAVIPASRSACAGDALDLRDRERCCAASMPAHSQGRVEQLARPGTTRFTSPTALGLLGVDRIAVRFISSAFATPTRRGSRCVPPKPGMIPSLISGWPKLGRVGRDADVARHRELAAAAEREPVDGSDRDDRAALERSGRGRARPSTSARPPPRRAW